MDGKRSAAGRGVQLERGGALVKATQAAAAQLDLTAAWQPQLGWQRHRHKARRRRQRLLAAAAAAAAAAALQASSAAAGNCGGDQRIRAQRPLPRQRGEALQQPVGPRGK